MDNALLLPLINEVLAANGVASVDQGQLEIVLNMVKERMTYVADFWPQASFFFQSPSTIDVDTVKPKWNANKTVFFEQMIVAFQQKENWLASELEPFFKQEVANSGMKIGELMMPYRIMLVGGKFGPDVFLITELLGKDEVIARIEKAPPLFQ